MAISTPTKMNTLSQTTTAAAITSASISPAANSLLIVVVGGQHSAGTAFPCTITDSLSGGALTWVDYESLADESSSSMNVIGWAKCGASPGSGAITATFNLSISRRQLVVIEVASGYNTTTPIAQNAINNALSGSTLVVTLGATPATTSLVIAGIYHRGTSPPTATFEAAFTSLDDTAGGTNGRMQVVYDQTGADNNINWANTGTVSNAGVMVEISEAAGGKAPLLIVRPIRVWNRRRTF